MSFRDQLNSYIQQLERRLRLGAMLRGAAILTSGRSRRHCNPRPDHQCPGLLTLEHYQRARNAALCFGAGYHFRNRAAADRTEPAARRPPGRGNVSRI